MSHEDVVAAIQDRFDGRYADLEYLAEGGMQVVFTADDRTLARSVVVKSPKEGVADRRFKRAAELSSRLNHPGIAATLDYFEDDAITFVVEEYVPGPNLRDVLARDYHFMDPWLAAGVVHQLARGVSVAHTLGVVHRDLKPSNVVVLDDPSLSVVKLTDFGIAKLAEAQIEYELDEFRKDDTTITGSQTLLGALPYMAPECLEDWRSAGFQSDVWSLGAIAYELIAGEPPFGAGVQAVVRVLQYANGAFNLERPSEFGKAACSAGIADQIWDAVARMLTPDPAARPSAADVLRICEEMTYGAGPRRHGQVSMYPSPNRHPYGKVQSGAQEFFFHRDEYFGLGPPVVGQRVSFSSYPGRPNERCQPVLALRTA